MQVKQQKQQQQLIEKQQQQTETALAVSRTFNTVAEVLASYPQDRFNLVLPLRAPKTPERYELWATMVVIKPEDCVALTKSDDEQLGKFMPLKHKVLELAREAGVIVERIEQVLPSTWKPLVELARELGKLPHAQNLSRDWILHDLQTLLQHRRNDVAVRASVLLEVAPGEFVRAIGMAEWVEEDERSVVERSVRKQVKKKGLNWDEDRIQSEIEDRMIDLRRFRLRLTETKALLRAIRAVLSLKTALTREELEKPFIVVSWRRIPPRNCRTKTLKPVGVRSSATLTARKPLALSRSSKSLKPITKKRPPKPKPCPPTMCPTNSLN
jgi:hypothetical protein